MGPRIKERSAHRKADGPLPWLALRRIGAGRVVMAGFERFGIFVLALTALLVASSALAGVQVARTISFAPSAGASDKVKQECQIQTQVPAAIQQAGTDVQLVDAPNKAARALELAISELHAPGGGLFSGPKWMTVEGKLYEKGKLIGSFRAKRHSVAVKSTCGTLARVSQAIGQDIAAWLNAPTMDGELGDAR
jgi:hypothetical protein